METTSATPWKNESSYWQPPRVFLSAWLEHSPFAFWLMSVLKPARVVELGTHTGFSFFVFCESVRRLGLDTHVYAVDTWAGDDHAGFYDESVFSGVVQGQREYAEHSTLLRGYFSDHVGSFEDGSIDLLHIDGRHGYDDVKEDFESWLPKVAPGGIVLFHDIAEHHADFGVWRLWDEVLATYPSFSFEHGHGLGVISAGQSVLPEIETLLSVDEDTTRQVRDIYSTLGAAVSHRWETQERHLQRIAVLEREIDLMRSSTSWRITSPMRAVMDRLRGDR